MKNLKIFLFPLLLGAFGYLTSLTGCQQYKTPIPMDPLYTSHPSPIENLPGGGGEKYTQRDVDHLQMKGNYQPLPQETYSDYKVRLFNTLILQQHEKEQLEAALLQKQNLLEALQKQLFVLQSKHVDLRLKLSALSPDQGKEATSQILFTRYEVQPGDTLQKIAHQFLDSYKGWLAIYRFNVERLPSGSNRIYPGTQLILPKINLQNSMRLHRAAQQEIAKEVEEKGKVKV